MIIRVIAHRVPLSVATGPTPPSYRALVLRRRDWNSVQFEVDVISRNFCWLGTQP